MLLREGCQPKCQSSSQHFLAAEMRSTKQDPVQKNLCMYKDIKRRMQWKKHFWLWQDPVLCYKTGLAHRTRFYSRYFIDLPFLPLCTTSMKLYFLVGLDAVFGTANNAGWILIISYISCQGGAAWLWGRHIGGRARRDCGGIQAVCANPAVGTAAGLDHSPLCHGHLLGFLCSHLSLSCGINT